MSNPTTLFDKIWDDHVVKDLGDGETLIYIDRHLVHEVTSPQAFEGLRMAGRGVRRLNGTLAVPDHNVPTKDRQLENPDPLSKQQLEMLASNVAAFDVPYIAMDDIRQGIVHVIGPELGWTQPGLTMVCGDSHTSTHGAFGTYAMGIGTSDVEHVLATQTMRLAKPKNMEIRIDGVLSQFCGPKDVALAIIGAIGTAGGTGHVMEYRGDIIDAMTMEGRMTVANMSIEAGARAGLMAPDATTFDYLKGRPFVPKGGGFDAAVSHWQRYKTEEGAKFDTSVRIAGSDIAPLVTWGTSPEDVVPITGHVPTLDAFTSDARRTSAQATFDYMGIAPGQAVQDLAVDRIFIGSCTNSRLEDLRAAAAILKGRKVAEGVKEAIVVPGSGLVKAAAEEEGLDTIFMEAGFEWREPGCSMCLGMNPDKAAPGERVASTSNRNFVGRQGPGSRTHLMGPAMAAAAAVKGHLADVRDFEGSEL